MVNPNRTGKAETSPGLSPSKKINSFTGIDLLRELKVRLKESGQPDTLLFNLIDELNAGIDRSDSPLFDIVNSIRSACISMEENAVEVEEDDEELDRQYLDELSRNMNEGLTDMEREGLETIRRSMNWKLPGAHAEFEQKVTDAGLTKAEKRRADILDFSGRLPAEIVQDIRLNIQALRIPKS